MPATREQISSILPTPSEAEAARETSRKVASLFKGVELKEKAGGMRPTENIAIEIRLDGDYEIVSLPISVFRFIEVLLDQVAQGNGVSIVPQHCEMTTRQAASHLGVSRPYLIGLLEEGKIPFHKVGTHRRLRFEDVQRYKKEMMDSSKRALSELVADGQELGL